MFNNIILDCLEIKAEVKITDKKAIIQNCNNILSKHFNSNAYNIFSKGDYIYLRFIPSRYFKNIDDLYELNDTNIETISIEDLYSLFIELDLPKEFLDNAIIKEIHLCKNVVLKNECSKYIEALTTIQHSPMLTVDKHRDSVSFYTPKIDLSYNNTVSQKTYIAYDKCQQLKNKINNNLDNLYLKNSLSEYDKKQLEGYEYTDNSISVDTNIMRLEIKLKNYKVDALAKQKLDKDKFYLVDFINLAEEKQLYTILNDYYVFDLLGNIFISLPKQKKQSKIFNLLTDLRSEYNLFDLEYLFANDKDMAKKFREICRRTQPKNNGLVKELSEKLLTFID